MAASSLGSGTGLRLGDPEAVTDSNLGGIASWVHTGFAPIDLKDFRKNSDVQMRIPVPSVTGGLWELSLGRAAGLEADAGPGA